MDNKYLVELFVPSLDRIFNVYIPVNRRVGNVINLLNKAISELTNGEYVGNNQTCLYDRETGQKLEPNQLIRETNIKNGSGILML